MKELRRLCRKFVRSVLPKFKEDLKTTFGVSHLNLSEKLVRSIYMTYYRPTVVEFSCELRDIIFSKNPFRFIEKTSRENWDLWYMLSFLKEEGMIRGGKISVGEEIERVLMRELSMEEIKIRLSKAFHTDVNKLLKKSVSLLIEKKFGKRLDYKAKFDQMPISVESMVFLLHMISKWYPFRDRFLFIGDDDFISIFSSLAFHDFSCTVVDIDEELLGMIDGIAERLKLNVDTKKVDVNRDKIRKKFLGFCTNPPYTEYGAKKFVDFGVKCLGKDGGRIFLELGDESIGSRYIFLQTFFSRKNLAIIEWAAGKINYPFILLHPNDFKLFERMKKLLPEDVIRNSYQIGADLIVLDFIPWKIKRIKVEGLKIYSYL